MMISGKIAHRRMSLPVKKVYRNRALTDVVTRDLLTSIRR